MVVNKWIVPLLMAGALANSAEAQPAAPAAAPATTSPEMESVEPIRCWWRTSASAVRVGEPFSVVLTCAVVETEGLTVVPSQAELEPSAMQMQPFEVMGGTQAPDLRTSDRRFFQYDYRLRLVSEDQFGKDVKLPELKITYRVRSRTDGEASEGRDLTYLLPAISIRILSLVPSDAVDIRDSSIETFQAIERQLSQADILRAVGGSLIGFGVLAAALALVRVISSSRKQSSTVRALASDATILRQIGRELAAVQRARRDAGWTPELAARLLTALRILGAYALGVSATPLAAKAGFEDGLRGDFAVRGRGFRGAKVNVPAWVTPRMLALERKRESESNGSWMSAGRAGVLEQLETSLTRLTAARYGRDTTVDDEALDEMLASGVSVLRRMKIENVWVVKKVFAIVRPKVDQESQSWTR